MCRNAPKVGKVLSNALTGEIKYHFKWAVKELDVQK
jgi:hypothetical protein